MFSRSFVSIRTGSKGIFHKPSLDPRQGVSKSPDLFPETRELVKQSAEKRVSEETRQNEQLLKEITDSKLIQSNAFFNLGWNYYADAEFNLAVSEYRKADEVLPDRASTYNNLANALTGMQDYNSAETMYNKALNIDPKNSVFYANFALMWFRKGLSLQYSDPEEAQRCFERAVGYYHNAIRFHSEFSPHIILGEQTYILYHSRYHNSLGNAYMLLEKFDQAIKEYRHAVALDPADPIIFSNLAEAYGSKDQIEERNVMYRKALEIYKKLVESSPETVDYDEVARILEKLNDWDQMIQVFTYSLKSNSKNSRIAAHLISAYQYMRREPSIETYEQAINVCKENIKMDSSDARAYFDLGLIYLHKGETEQAIFELNRSARLNQNRADVHFTLGYAYYRARRFQMACICIKRAIELEPSNLNYHQNLGMAYHELQEYDRAMESLEKARDGGVDNTDLLIALADCYIYGSRADLDTALNLCIEAKIKDSNDSAPYEICGRIYSLQKRFFDAANEYKEAYLRYPQEEILQEIISAFVEALRQAPANPSLHYGLGRALEQSSNLTAAEDEYKGAMRLDPNNPVYISARYIAVGKKYYQEQKFDSAINEWKKIDKVNGISDPIRAEVYIDIANAYDRLGDPDMALSYYERAGKLIPDDSVMQVGLRHELGASHFDAGRYDLAIDEFQEVCSLLPNFAIPLYNLGNCYYLGGLVDVAKDCWQEAIRLDERLIDAYFNLGVMHLNQKDKDIANSMMRRILSIDPMNEDASTTLKDLEQNRSSSLQIHGIIRLHALNL